MNLSEPRRRASTAERETVSHSYTEPADARASEPVGLYGHVPFCTTKCGYCDFYSLPMAGRNPVPLVDALLRELQARAAPVADRLSTVFLGGGTPTLLPIRELQRLLEAINALLGGRSLDEFTVEANPATVDEAKIAVLVEAGVSRISFGAQSFHPDELAALERIHDPADTARSVALARRGGLCELNLDLMFGIPGQSLDSFDESLSRALDLGPDHLSVYGLTYEPGTPLKVQLDRGLITPCDEPLERDMYCHAIDRLTAAGFEHYEISNFARPNRRCRHNLAYWHNHPYVGIGPSAASFRNGERTRNVPNITRYLAMMRDGQSAVIETERLEPLAFAGETAMVTLRLIDGIDRRDFRETTGFDPFAIFAEPIQQHTAGGLIVVEGDRFRLTREGLLLADAVIADFLSPASAGT